MIRVDDMRIDPPSSVPPHRFTEIRDRVSELLDEPDQYPLVRLAIGCRYGGRSPSDFGRAAARLLARLDLSGDENLAALAALAELLDEIVREHRDRGRA